MKTTFAVLFAVVLALLGLRGLLFPHVFVYEYKFGTLGSDPAYYWTGPFTGAALGTFEYGYPKPLPDIYIHWPDGYSARLLELREDALDSRFAKMKPLSRAYSSVLTGDIEVGFMKGRVRSLQYRHRQGWPCFSAHTDSPRFCFPLSRSDARELFGKPWDIHVHDIGWH